MTARTTRLIIAVLGTAIVLGGCTWGRRTSISPRQLPQDSQLSADLQALRHENDQLRRQQQQTDSKIIEMRQVIAQGREEQRRFQETMATNFDLLEQSLALALAQGITADMPAPAAARNARPSASAPQGTAPPPAPSAHPHASAAPERQANEHAPPGDSQIAANADPAAMAQRPAGDGTAVNRDAALAAMVMGGQEDSRQTEAAFQDPDLMPPASPTRLIAHREAKPLYEKGFALFARKHYDQSIIVFRNFLNRFPNDIYSDNAQFWIGESYLNLDRGREAENSYRKVLRNYEHRSTLEGYKTPDAIYRLAQAHQKRDDLRRARYYYQALAERFPDTSAGRKAQRELDTIGLNTAAR